MARKSTPKQFSAYLITASDIEQMPVGATIIDKGSVLLNEWNMINLKTGKDSHAVGHRLSRLCVDCRVTHKRVGILGHDGECGSEPVVEEAKQVLTDAKKRVAA